MNNFAIVWILSLLVKLLLSTVIPLSTDEAYYWAWSQAPQLSYFDHPPFVAWLFWLGNHFPFFVNTERWAGIFLGHFTLLVLYFIWKELLSNELNTKKFWLWFYLFIFSPLMGLGSIILTPDLPVVFFWCLSLLFAIRIFKNHAIADYIGLGAALGLGFCSKYHIVLFVPSLLFYISFEKKWREVKLLPTALCILTGLIFCMPVLLWNWQHDFVSFNFQLNHGLNRTEYRFYWTWSFIVGQIFLIFPTVLFYFLKAKLKTSARILYYFAYFPLAFFLATSFRALVEANWPIIAYPSIFLIAATEVRSLKTVIATLACWIFLYTLIISESKHHWMPNPNDKLNETRLLTELYNKTNTYRPLFLSTYQIASYFWYLNKAPMYKLYASGRVDFYDFLKESHPTSGEFYFLANGDTDLPSWITEDLNYSWSIIEKLDSNYRVFKVNRRQND